MSRREDRCSPIPLWILYEVPPAYFRPLVIATAEGRSMNPRGTFDSLFPKERPIGIRVSSVHRDRILAKLGKDIRSWQRWTRSWIKAGLAHPCAKGVLFVSLRPVQDICPACQGRWSVASTRHESDIHATPERPSHVQTGEPSTGTQRGKAVDLEVVYEEVGSEIDAPEPDLLTIPILDALADALWRPRSDRDRAAFLKAASNLASRSASAAEVKFVFEHWAETHTSDPKLAWIVENWDELRRGDEAEPLVSDVLSGADRTLEPKGIE